MDVCRRQERYATSQINAIEVKRNPTQQVQADSCEVKGGIPPPERTQKYFAI